MPKLTRIALLAVAVQQARKFAQTPRGQQLIAQAKQVAGDPQARSQLIGQAKQAASDPQARAQLVNQVKSMAGGGGGASAGQPGAADPYPPSTQPLASASPASPGPATGSGPGSVPPPPIS
jgi:hypothetical protein